MTTNVPANSESRVALFNLNPGEVRHEFLMSVVNLLVHDTSNKRYLAGVYTRIAGGNLAIHRGEVVDRFLELEDCDWLWMVDSDIAFSYDTLDMMMEAADPRTAPIVSGLYSNVGIDGNLVPMAYDYDNGFSPVDPTVLRDNDALWVDGIGAGCLLVHRSVFERMKERYAHLYPAMYFGNDLLNQIVNGEDFTFCIRVRALEIPILLLTKTDLIHIKAHGITNEMLYRQLDEQKDSEDDSNA